MSGRIQEHDCRACLYYGMGCVDLNCTHFMHADEDLLTEAFIEDNRLEYTDAWYDYIEED